MAPFIISLDFELFWGVRAKKTVEEYRENLLGVQKVIPLLLDIFEEYNITATFATVGFLFCNNKDEWRESFPEVLPTYHDDKQSNYTEQAINDVERDESGVFHFAPKLISLIRNAGHEIGTHTHSHFYCQEKGQTPEQFRADLRAAKIVAAAEGIQYSSIVFPRNQFTPEYLRVCATENISTYRGNPAADYYSAKGDHEETKLNRLKRLLDTYINLSGHNCYPVSKMNEGALINIPASMFLRPYSATLSLFEGLRLRRITRAMTYAAKNDLAFHLWWHPHNFGKNIEENFSFLRKILDHYTALSQRWPIRSMTMEQLSHKIKMGANKLPAPIG